jgi:DNA repair exonuclease SbcCD ATPase subunit
LVTLSPFWFFALIEFCFFLAVVSGFALWQWIRLKRRTHGIFAHWDSTRQMLDGAQQGLQLVRSDGNEDIKIKLEAINIVASVFHKELAEGVKELKTAIDHLLRLMDRPGTIPKNSPPVRHADSSPPPEPIVREKALEEEVSDIGATLFGAPVGPLTALSQESYQSMITLVGEQNEKLQELQEYKQAVAGLTGKLQHLSIANHKLVEYVRASAVQDERFKPLRQMMDKFQENGADIVRTVSDLEQDHHRFEPKVTSLMLENQHLVKALTQYRKQIDKVLDERDKLQERTKELETKLEIRNKSYSRLHSKFEALRREYITLYELSGRNAQSRGPISD